MVVCESVNEVIEYTVANKEKEVIAWNLPLGDSGAIKVAEALRTNDQITKLVLYSCEIGHDGAMELAEALSINKNLQAFDYCGNNIGGIANKKIREVWARTRLKWSSSIETSGGRTSAPVFPKKYKSFKPTHIPKNESQFSWARAHLGLPPIDKKRT